MMFVFLVDLRVEPISMVSFPRYTNEGIHFCGILFVSPSAGHVGPPYITTLSLPSLMIGLPVWLFSTLMNVNYPSDLYVNTPPHDHQPHFYPIPSSPIGYSSHSSSSPSEISIASNQVVKKNKKQKIKKNKNKKEGKFPTTAGHVGRYHTTSGNHAGTFDGVVKSKKNNHKPKFPYMLCKGDNLLKDFHGIPKVVEVWSQVSS
jgi:hypothetical protein